MRVHRWRARSVRPAFWRVLFALCLSGAVQAADRSEEAAPAEPEGSAALLPEQAEPSPGIADAMAGTRATWLVPAEYSRSIGAVSVLQVRPDIYMLTVDGANVVVQTGWQGTLVINTAGTQQCDALVAAIKAIAQAPIRYIVNTSADADRVGCNAQVAQAGHAFMRTQLGFAAPVIAHQNVMMQLLASGTGVSTEGLPSEIFTRPVRSMYVNDQAIQIFWMPGAHSDGDTMVVFRRSDVVVAGDILDVTRFPVVDLAHGGSINGEIAALNRLLNEFAVAVTPKFQRPGGTLIIPGRGQLGMHTDVLNYRDMVTIVRDRVQALLEQGKSLEQVLAARPARGYESRYGSESGSWTTRNFIEAIYKSLKTERSARKQSREKK